MSTSHPPSGEKIGKGDEKARERDPHGTAPSDEAREHDPAGSPSSDRHETETASGVSGPRQNKG